MELLNWFEMKQIVCCIWQKLSWRKNQQFISGIQPQKNEVMILFAIFMLQCIERKPKEDLYWCKWEILYTPIFVKFLSKRKYKAFMQLLHFTANETYNPKLIQIQNYAKYGHCLSAWMQNLWVPTILKNVFL